MCVREKEKERERERKKKRHEYIRRAGEIKNVKGSDDLNKGGPKTKTIEAV